MRKIKLIWETTTGQLSVDSFDNITRNDLYELELHNQSRGSNYLLGEDEVITAVGKQRPDGAVLVKVENFTRPSNALLPYTATVWIGGEDLNNAFQDGDQEHEFLDLKFELQSSGGPNTSARLPLRVHNELTREGEDWIPPGVTAGGGKVDIQVFHESGTWVKPEGAQYVEVQLWGGGGGGSSGIVASQNPVNSTYSGGVGSGPGHYLEARGLAGSLDDTVPVIVGEGGLGGVFNEGLRGTGSVGEASTFGTLSALGGTATGGDAPNGIISYNQTTLRTIPGVSSGSGVELSAANQLIYRYPTGGGAGGRVVRSTNGESSGNTPYEGYRGGNVGTGSMHPVAGAMGGSLDWDESPDGANGKVDPISGHALGAGGGAGGESTAGNGGHGAVPGGAAGGGGSCSHWGQPGSGGNGGKGLVIVKTYCK